MNLISKLFTYMALFSFIIMIGSLINPQKVLGYFAIPEEKQSRKHGMLWFGIMGLILYATAVFTYPSTNYVYTKSYNDFRAEWQQNSKKDDYLSITSNDTFNDFSAIHFQNKYGVKITYMSEKDREFPSRIIMTSPTLQNAADLQNWLLAIETLVSTTSPNEKLTLLKEKRLQIYQSLPEIDETREVKIGSLTYSYSGDILFQNNRKYIFVIHSDRK